MFSKEKKEDKELIHELKEKKGHEKKEKKKAMKKPKDNMDKVMGKFKAARLKGRSEMPKRKKGY